MHEHRAERKQVCDAHEQQNNPGYQEVFDDYKYSRTKYECRRMEEYEADPISPRSTTCKAEQDQGLLSGESRWAQSRKFAKDLGDFMGVMVNGLLGRLYRVVMRTTNTG